MEATFMSINRKMNKEDMVHIYDGILLSKKKKKKKEWIMSFAPIKMDLEIVLLSELSQAEKDKRFHVYYCLYVES